MIQATHKTHIPNRKHFAVLEFFENSPLVSYIFFDNVAKLHAYTDIKDQKQENNYLVLHAEPLVPALKPIVKVRRSGHPE